MHDTTNLKKRLKEYEKLLSKSLSSNHSDVTYYNSEIADLKDRIESRKKNQAKNQKAYKKAHGYFS